MTKVENSQAFSLFISDLHLCQSRPEITHQFISFLASKAREASALYILGDFFEYWAGDDDLDDPAHTEIITALRELSDHGVSVFFMHGNRDFLLADAFATKAGLKILNDPSLISIHGHRVLLSHGDALCTDDLAYQNFRSQVRQPEWQAQFLQQSLQARKAQIEDLRKRSENEKSQKSLSIMDVNAEAVIQLVRDYSYPPILIHGHTHRPARHIVHIDDHTVERWVLGDWYEQGSCLRLDASGCSSQDV